MADVEGGTKTVAEFYTRLSERASQQQGCTIDLQSLPNSSIIHCRTRQISSSIILGQHSIIIECYPYRRSGLVTFLPLWVYKRTPKTFVHKFVRVTRKKVQFVPILNHRFHTLHVLPSKVRSITLDPRGSCPHITNPSPHNFFHQRRPQQESSRCHPMLMVRVTPETLHTTSKSSPKSRASSRFAI